MVKNLPASVADAGLIPDPGRSYVPSSSYTRATAIDPVLKTRRRQHNEESSRHSESSPQSLQPETACTAVKTQHSQGK